MRTIILSLFLAAQSTFAVIYPSSDWFGQNVQKQTTAAAVRAVLGISAGSATNVFFLDSANIHWDTLGGSNRFTAFGLATTNAPTIWAPTFYGLSTFNGNGISVNFLTASALAHFNGGFTAGGGEFTDDVVFNAHSLIGVNGGSLTNLNFYGTSTFNGNGISVNFLTASQVAHFNGGFDATDMTYTGDFITPLNTKIFGTTPSGLVVGASLSGLSWDGTTLTATHAATATDADFATEATKARGLIDTDSADALTVTLTKIIATTGHQFVGDAGGASNLQPAFISGVVTNASVPVFNSISEMVSSGLSNDVVEVVGYWGNTNTFGGGRFRLRTGVTLSTNFGTIFTNKTGSTGTAGYRERIREATNYYRLDWFGVRPMNTDATATIHDSYQRVTNCIEVAGNFCDIVFPPYGFAVSQTLIVSNKTGFVWRGAGNGSSRTTYPEKASWISYIGTSTTLPLVKLIDSQRARIEDIGFETSTPTYSSGGNYVTNNALVGLDIDQSGSSWPQITTGIRVNRCYFRSRGTNVTWIGVRISDTSTSNCEDIRLFDCGFAGGGYWDGSTGVLSTANDPIAIKVGNSANARGLVFDTITWTDCKYGVYALSGGWMIRNVLCTGSLADFYIHSAVGPIDIDGVQSEEQKMAVWIDNFGVGAYGSDIVPISIRNSHFHYSPTGWRTPTLALIPIQSQAKLVIENSVFSGVANQRVFDPTNTTPISVTSWGNTYPTNDLGVVGITNLTYGIGDEYMRDGNGNYSRGWRVIGQYFQDAVISNGTNFSRMRVHGQGLNLNETNGIVRIGPINTFGVDSDPNLSVWSRKNSVSFTMGDTNIGNRLQLHNNGNANQTELDVVAATNREARVRLIEKTGGYSQDLFAGFNKVGIKFTNGNWTLIPDSSGASHMTVGPNGFTISPTGNVATIASTQINLNGSITLTGMMAFRTNILAALPTAPANYGQLNIFNSNGYPHAEISGPSLLTWTSTNPIFYAMNPTQFGLHSTLWMYQIPSGALVTNLINKASGNTPAFETIHQTPDNNFYLQVDNTSAPGYHFKGDVLLDNGTFNLANLTASRMLFLNSGKNVTAATASGAVPINADSTATTAAQLQTVVGGQFLTNGNTFNFTTAGVSNYHGGDITIGGRFRLNRTQLLTTGNATNYALDFATNVPNVQWISATGDVFMVFTNMEAGALKNLFVTNVYWGSSNIGWFINTNSLCLGTNVGSPVSLAGPGSAWVKVTVTNSAKGAFSCEGTTTNTVSWFIKPRVIP